MLLTINRPGETQVGLSNIDAVTTDKVETLRQILAMQEQREIGYDEARDIGASLIEFYQVLAEEVDDEFEE